MGLGLTKLHKTVIREDRPEIQGMIRKVRHLVYVEEIPEGQYETARDQTGTRIDETT
jgi:large subunit ribosomal protein L30